MANRFDKPEFNGVPLVRDVFIETGTFMGDSLWNASQMGFNTLHSCEVVPRYAEMAKQRFANDPRVQIHQGSSPEVLQGIIDPKRDTTFWLDAHFQGGHLYEQDPIRGECPLMEELKIIFSARWTMPPIVVIDDSRIFSGAWRGTEFLSVFRESHWPTVQQIFSVLPKGYVLSDFDDALWCLPSVASM